MHVVMERTPHTERLRDERGAALLEFALAVPLLLVLLVGIVSYGVLLSFKQSMTQVAAEGARAAAVAAEEVDAEVRAKGSVDAGVARVLDRTCDDPTDPDDSDALSCTYSVDACDSGASCITVELRYDNAASPLVPPLPFVSAVLPSTLTSSAVVRLPTP